MPDLFHWQPLDANSFFTSVGAVPSSFKLFSFDIRLFDDFTEAIEFINIEFSELLSRHIS